MINLQKVFYLYQLFFNLTEWWVISNTDILKPEGTILILSSSFQHSTDHESVATAFPEISSVTCSSEKKQMENTLLYPAPAHGNW